MSSIFLLSVIFSVFTIIGTEASPLQGNGTYFNPIFKSSFLTPDPFVYFHTDGFYYYSHTTRYELIVFKSRKLTDFSDAENATVFHCPEPWCGNMWAPEIHFLQGNFYIYFTMEDKSHLGHRMFVIRALNSSDPLGAWSNETRLAPTTEDFYAIDGTVLQHSDGKMYFLWSGSYNGTENFPQKIFITRMASPMQLNGPRVLLKGPSYPWESKVNEGPHIIQRGNRTFLVYSSYMRPEGMNPNYCLLIAHLDGDRDPVDSGNWWHKTDGPVFWRNDEEGVYGPGHASFTSSPDGTETWMVYHAVDIPDDGSWDFRTARTEKIEWSEDNYPIFPRPAGLFRELVRPSGEV